MQFTNEQLEEIFFNWLKTYNADQKFKNNWKNHFSVATYFEQLARGNIINAAFYWDATPEGFYFWNRLHSKWFDLTESDLQTFLTNKVINIF